METETVRRLGVLLSRGPGSEGAEGAIELSRAALRRGLEVELFLMAEGVGLLGGPEIAGLISDGARVRVCTHSATGRGAPLDAAGVDYASQHQLAQSVAGADRFVSFS